MYNFEKLTVWQKAINLCESIYQETKRFPREEMFGLISQFRRAAVSIPLNIAEGSACRSKKEFIHFLTISLRSQFEIITLIKLSYRLKLLSKVSYSLLFSDAEEVGKLLNGLISSLKTKN